MVACRRYNEDMRRKVGYTFIYGGVALAFVGFFIDILAWFDLYAASTDNILWVIGFLLGLLGVLISIFGGLILPPHRPWWRRDYRVQLQASNKETNPGSSDRRPEEG